MPVSLEPSSIRVPAEESSPSAPHAHDLALARRVLDGDRRAWDHFVQLYAGLMYAVIRRHLRTTDVDDIRSVLVDVLVVVRSAKLGLYEGRAALSTWLAVVARSEALDFLRRRHGRPRYQRLIAQLSDVDRLVLRLYHFEGCSPHQVVAALSGRGEECTLEDVIEKIRSLEERLGGAWMEDVAYELHARNVGFASARMLAYLDHLRDDAHRQAEIDSPESSMIEREARETAERLAEVVGRLAPGERELIELRYHHGRTAEQVARDLGIDNPRTVYAMTQRVIRKIRVWFEESRMVRR